MLAYFKGKSLVSRLIKWRTWGKYSHVAWIVDRDFWLRDIETGRQLELIKAGTIFESWHRKSKGAKRNGVRRGVAGDLHKPGTVVDLHSIPIDDAHYNAMLHEWLVYVNDPTAKYDFRGVTSGFILRKESAHSELRQFCSEVALRCLRAVRYRFLINIEPYMLSPDHMATSPVQRFVGTWKTGTPFPTLDLPEGQR